jgi:hypothetical protein
MGQMQGRDPELDQDTVHVDPFARGVKSVFRAPVHLVLTKTTENHGFLQGRIEANYHYHGRKVSLSGFEVNSRASKPAGNGVFLIFPGSGLIFFHHDQIPYRFILPGVRSP